MIFDFMVLMMVGLVVSFLSGAGSAPCPSSTVQVNITSTADLQNLTDALACSGKGLFDITWFSNLDITQSIEVSDSKDVAVTGNGSPSIRGALPDGSGAGAGAGNGIFSVSNKSSLRLVDLVIEGGNAEFGGAVKLHSSSSLFVFGCVFVNNTASDGGAIHLCGNSTMQVNGITSFLDNIAEQDGGAVFASANSIVSINGDIKFYNNSAGGTGGAIKVVDGSSLLLGGSTSFQNNRAESDGGAVGVANSAVATITGEACFANNMVNRYGGAIAAFQASVTINDNASFVDNVAKENGGALIANGNSIFVLDGTITFDNNSAGNLGGALSVVSNSIVETNGRVSFLNSHAGLSGGAMHANSGSVFLYGDTSMNNNSADSHGGEIEGQSNFCEAEYSPSDFQAVSDNSSSCAFLNHYQTLRTRRRRDPRVCIPKAMPRSAMVIGRGSLLATNGNTVFNNNSASGSGGVISAFSATLEINGNTSAAHNSANSQGGGAIFASQTDINMGGCASILHNSGYDGGAILAQGSDILITGNVTFAYNSARRDGGAMKTFDTRLIIGTMTQEAELSSTSSLTGGVTMSAPHLDMSIIGAISFIENTAIDFGGALSLANYLEINISDVKFHMNRAKSGGAVSLTSTTSTTADFKRCRFELNNATTGGALHWDGRGLGHLQGCSFWLNVADTGGALFNTGPLKIEDTVFAENTAKEEGLAMHSMESAVELWNVTFEGNILSCPSQMYSDTDDVSPDRCRFEVVCARCLDGCDSDLSNVTIDIHTLPVCEPVPVGVWPSSPPTTLRTFDIKEGYFRISAESTIVLECYQKDACVGGIDQRDYCAIGYTGPYCAVCTEGYAPGPSSRCHECSEENWGLLVAIPTAVLFISLVAIVLVVSYLVEVVRDGANDEQNQPRQSCQENVSRLHSFFMKAIPLSTIRIVVTVLQIMIQFTEIAGDVYPDEYSSFLSAMAVVNYDVGFFLSSSCFTPMDFYGRLVLATVAPIATVIACGGTFMLASMRNRGSNSAGLTVRHKHLSVVLFLVFFVYSSVSFTVFQTFVCDSLDDGISYLRADYSITCFTERHAAYQLYASLMVFVYPVGIPAFFAFLLVRHRRELQKPNREALPHLNSYRCLWAAYKPSCYYYEVVECCRRIVLTAVAVFILPRTSAQIAIVLFLAVVFVFISESISPFQLESDKWLYRWGNGIIVTSMYIAFLLKIEVTQDGTHSSSAITILLIAANVFMVLIVAVNAFILMRRLCAS